MNTDRMSKDPTRHLSRRDVVAGVAAGVATGTAALSFGASAATRPSIKAIAFDGFPIFDPRSLAALARKSFGERGDMLVSLWSNKLFGYTWLNTSAGRYVGFEELADASLRFAANSLGLALPDGLRGELVGAYSKLDIWPDVRPALARLRGAGIRLIFLSNLSEAMLNSNMDNAGIRSYFEATLSTDRVKQYKPAPKAYQMAIDVLGLPKKQIGFAAFGGWDALGATWFGYRTAWINRTRQAPETLDMQPAIMTGNIDGVLALAGLV